MTQLQPQGLKNIQYWVFDLDNTLYPHHCDLFAGIDQRMGEYITQKIGLPADEAKKLQKELFHFYGTTLRGLQEKYNVDPDDYLRFTHDIDYSVIPEDTALLEKLNQLSGAKYIFTNGSHEHAITTLDRIGIRDCFSKIFDIKQGGYEPKPQPQVYDMMVKFLDINPTQSIMLDDIAKNLMPAAKLGMKTVLIDTGDVALSEGYDEYIDFRNDDLHDFLAQVLG